jgi:LysM repeat protein
VQQKNTFQWLLLILLLVGFILPVTTARASQPLLIPPDASQVTAYDLIVAMNTLRVSYGLPALVEDPIIDSVAQSTAQTMAANEMSWHIGNVSGRLQSAGYGGGAKVWATENFAEGFHTLDEIMLVWSDASHMIPAVNAAYCNVGAGVATAPNGAIYYVLQAAYTSAKACGDYKSVGTIKPGSGVTGSSVSQVIVSVKIATPDADGKIFHIVQAGQSFWSIAIAYKVTIKDLETWNNLSKDAKLQIGEKLFIPGNNTKGYFTPTPEGMILLSTPNTDGKIVHVVEVYQTLSTISTAYGVKVDTILALNVIQVDWPLQIGQKLVIRGALVTPSPTPRPLTPLEKLTPDSDGKYYHIVKSGETLTWIANLYQVKLADLMTWNNLNQTSILRLGQKLLLQVSPPATITPTAGPPTATSTPTQDPPTPTITLTPTLAADTPTSTPVPSSTGDGIPVVLLGFISLVAFGIAIIVIFSRRKN